MSKKTDHKKYKNVWKKFDENVKEFRKGFAHMTDDEIMKLVDEELAEVRKERELKRKNII